MLSVMSSRAKPGLPLVLIFLVAVFLWIAGSILGGYLAGALGQNLLTTSATVTLARVVLPMVVVIGWVLWTARQAGILGLLWREPYLVKVTEGGSFELGAGPLAQENETRSESGLLTEPDADPIYAYHRPKGQLGWWIVTGTAVAGVVLKLSHSILSSNATFATVLVGSVGATVLALGSELLLRGNLLVRARQRIGNELGAAFVSILFTGLWYLSFFALGEDLGATLVGSVQALGGAVLLYGIRRATGSLSLPVIIHAAWLLAAGIS